MEENASPESPGISKEKPATTYKALIAYIPFLCFVPLFSQDTDAYARQHGKQGLLLLIVEIVAVIMLLPIGDFFWKVVLIACFIASVAGIVHAQGGKPFEIPFIGKWADKL
jgi:uncharacterized membrane protein